MILYIMLPHHSDLECRYDGPIPPHWLPPVRTPQGQARLFADKLLAVQREAARRRGLRPAASLAGDAALDRLTRTLAGYRAAAVAQPFSGR